MTETKKPAPKKKDEPKAFDLDAAIEEVTNEAEDTPFEFRYQGKDWTMRPVSQSDAKLMANIELTEVQQIMAYMRDLLGEEQWAEFPRISYQGAMLLIEQYADHAQGVGLGESEAPTDS